MLYIFSFPPSGWGCYHPERSGGPAGRPLGAGPLQLPRPPGNAGGPCRGRTRNRPPSCSRRWAGRRGRRHSKGLGTRAECSSAWLVLGPQPGEMHGCAALGSGPGRSASSDGGFKLLGSAFWPELVCESLTAKRSEKVLRMMAQPRSKEDSHSVLLLLRYCANYCNLV